MIDFIKDIVRFIFERKKFWMLPVFILLLLIGILLLATGNTVLAPFIYTLF